MEVFIVMLFLVLLCSVLAVLAYHFWAKAKALEIAAYDLIELDTLQSMQYARNNPHVFTRW